MANKIYTAVPKDFKGYGGATERIYVVQKNGQDTNLNFETQYLAEQVADYIETEVKKAIASVKSLQENDWRG